MKLSLTSSYKGRSCTVTTAVLWAVILSSVVLSQPRPMTLVEAFETIAKLRPDAAVIYLYSVDHTEDSSLSGQDGRRRIWQVHIIRPGTGAAQVRLVDGVIVEEVKRRLGHKPILQKPAVDSPEAVKLAKAAKPDIELMTSKARGFHFALKSGVITLRASLRGDPAIIKLNSTTGQILLSAQRMTLEGSGGIIYSADGGQTWAASNLKGRLVSDVYPDPLSEGQAYAAVIEEETIHIYRTLDGGRTWILMTDLPQAAGKWAFSLIALAEPSGNTLLLVGTRTGLWIWRDGKGWSRASGLPEGPKQWLAATQSSRGYRVFVSITAGTNRGLYASPDLSSWNRESDVPYRLSESYNRQAVLAIDRQKRGPALLLTEQGRQFIDISEPVLVAAGAFDGSAPMILCGRSRIIKRFRESVTWSELNVANLTVPRGFPTSQVAIAGGFRNGIYRSRDGGQTWHLVLSDPSALIQGSGEIYAVKFLSSKSVIAAIGGDKQWKEF